MGRFASLSCRDHLHAASTEKGLQSLKGYEVRIQKEPQSIHIDPTN